MTGLRFSDYSRIAKQHLKKYKNEFVLEIRYEKTGDLVEVPLVPEAEKIVTKLISGEVHAISDQKMSMFVKELCEKAGINNPCELHRFVGNKKQLRLNQSLSSPPHI